MFIRQRSLAERGARAATASAAVALVLAVSGCAGQEAGGAEGGSGEETFEFTLATGATAGTPNAAAQDWFLDRVEEKTDGRITFERTATEALCKMQEVVDCVRDGRAEIGVTVPDYTPQYFPSTSMVSIPFESQNAQAITQTIYEIHRDYEPARQVMDSNGLHHVATWPVGRFLLGTPDPVGEVDGLEGLRMRASGPIVQQVLGEAKANVVALTAAETYEGVERGVVDGVGGAIDFPVNYKLMEQLPHWSDPGVGQYSVFGMWLSKDAYEGLPDDLKQTFDEVVEEFNTGAAMESFNESAATQCQQMLDSPNVESLTAWDDSAVEEWKDQVGDSGRQAWIELATDQGLEDAEGILDRYLQGLEEHADLEYTDATTECVEQFASR